MLSEERIVGEISRLEEATGVLREAREVTMSPDRGDLLTILNMYINYFAGAKRALSFVLGDIGSV